MLTTQLSQVKQSMAMDSERDYSTKCQAYKRFSAPYRIFANVKKLDLDMIWLALIGVLVTYLLIDWLIRLPRISNYGNKCVFITGANNGFGRDLAIRLDSMGFRVFAGCHSQNGRSLLTSQCSSRLFILDLEVSQTTSIQAALDIIKRELPDGNGLWAVVNNAGIIGLSAKVEMCRRQDFIDVCEVNLFGPIEVCRLFAPLLRKSKGRFVTMSSSVGRFSANPAGYCVSKFGLEAYCDILRRDMDQFGVKVSILESGAFNTNIVNVESSIDKVQSAYNSCDEEVKAAYGLHYLEQSRKEVSFTRRLLDSNPTDKVIDTYVDALTCRYPRCRYVVGLDAKLSILMSFMPEWVTDTLFRLFFP